MSQQSNGTGGALVLVGAQNGITLVPTQTPLTRLNYFDGKFLRAADLEAEQRYLRQLVALSNQGGGPGVVHGLSATLSPDGGLKLGAGLAVDSAGRSLLLPYDTALDLQALIDASTAPTPVSPGAGTGGAGGFQICETPQAPPAPGSTQVVAGATLYLITICHAEALCGEEDVYGKLCEESCVTSTNRPYRLEGLVVRALPLSLVTPYPTSSVVALSELHLRSRVASSYYADERNARPHQISHSGLTAGPWCLGGGYDASACDVPLAVLARTGTNTLFLDAWIARRERMEAPAKRYWAWKMRMRPWDVFLAQILQFQCHLAHVLAELPGEGPDACQPSMDLLGETSVALTKLQTQLAALAQGGLGPSLLEIDTLKAKIQALLGSTQPPLPTTHTTGVLIQHGLVELPSAGYLPVANQTAVSVNEQVRALLGEGVDLRFCVVRPDFVAHALEEVQHMERISLLEGLEAPGKKPEVDILVPDGNIVQGSVQSGSTLYATTFFVGEPPEARGVTRTEVLPTGGVAFYSADTWSTVPAAAGGAGKGLAAMMNQESEDGSPDAVWIAGRWEHPLRSLKANQSTPVNLRLVAPKFDDGELVGDEFQVNGIVSVTQIDPGSPQGLKLMGTLTLFISKLHLQSTVSQPIGSASKQTWSLTLTFQGDDANGSVTVLLTRTQTSELPEKFELTLTRTQSPQPRIDIVVKESRDADDPDHVVAKAGLEASADVLQASNPFHQNAESALDLCQSLLSSEATFRQVAQALLFPPAPASTSGLTVQAVHDWVLFHRRRTKQCAPVVEAPQVQPPSRYRVYELTVSDRGQAEALKSELKGGNFDPVFRTNSFLIEFEAGLAKLLPDATPLAEKWKGLAPQSLIYFIAAGAQGADTQALQILRIQEVEKEITASSTADGNTDRHAIIPFPDGIKPVDADGLMIFVTYPKPA